MLPYAVEPDLARFLNPARAEVDNYRMKRRGGEEPGLKVALAVTSTLPTVIWAMRGAAPMVDDWSFAATAHLHGLSGFESAVIARPLGGAYYAVAFNFLHDHPLPHLLVLATLNAVAALLVLAVARRLMPRTPAVLTAVVWVALANRGTSRLWITAHPTCSACASCSPGRFSCSGGRLTPTLAPGPCGRCASWSSSPRSRTKGRSPWAALPSPLRPGVPEDRSPPGSGTSPLGCCRSGWPAPGS